MSMPAVGAITAALALGWGSVLPIALAAAQGGASPGDLRAAIGHCAKLTDTGGRLACYDRIAASLGLRARPAAQLGKQWTLRRNENPLDDTATVYGFTTAISGKNVWGRSPVLVVRCQSNSTDVYVNWNTYLGDDGDLGGASFKSVTYRVDKGQPMTGRWTLSTDSEATFASSPIALMRKMVGAERLVVRVVPFEQNPIVAVFDISNGRPVYEDVAKTCGWQLDKTDQTNRQ